MDGARALVAVLEAARLETESGYSAIFHLPNLVDMAADAPTLLDYAAQSEERARTVCMAIVGGEDAFWPIAFRLVELYPGGRMEQDLTFRVERMGQIISGPSPNTTAAAVWKSRQRCSAPTSRHRRHGGSIALLAGFG